jgi:hypothetical protein
MFGHAAFLGGFQVRMNDKGAGQRLGSFMRGTAARFERYVVVSVFG